MSLVPRFRQLLLSHPAPWKVETCQCLCWALEDHQKRALEHQIHRVQGQPQEHRMPWRLQKQAVTHQIRRMRQSSGLAFRTLVLQRRYRSTQTHHLTQKRCPLPQRLGLTLRMQMWCQKPNQLHQSHQLYYQRQIPRCRRNPQTEAAQEQALFASQTITNVSSK
jgi:hypothetical protein